MAYGFLIESQKFAAKDVDALNRSAVADANVDGGAIVTLGTINSDGVFVATKATAGTGGNVWMAYNPSEHFTSAHNNMYAGLTVDPREYTNVAGRTLDVFKPQISDIIILTEGNIKSGETVTEGSYLEMGTDGYEVQSSATASTFSLKVLEVGTLPFPQAGIGDDFTEKYVCEVVFN